MYMFLFYGTTFSLQQFSVKYAGSQQKRQLLQIFQREHKTISVSLPYSDFLGNAHYTYDFKTKVPTL